MVDGTQDITSTEQESICFRHVDAELRVKEDFVGLYELPDTTGNTIASVIFDVLTRLSLSHCDLRAQTYDGASNMKGPYNGCQAKALFKSVASEESTHPATVASVRPLCPTRWLCRLPAIASVLDNYEIILCSLQELSTSGTGETSVKANGLFDRFEKGHTLLGLQMAMKPIAILEQLNSTLQARSANVSGMLEAARIATKEIRSSRSDEEFLGLYEATEQKIKEYNLEPLQLPRRRRVPQRLAGEGVQYTPDNPKKYYREKYFSFVDNITVQLEDRFDPSKSGLGDYVQLEEVLLGTRNDMNIVKRYPELNADALAVQLPMFRHTTGASSLYASVAAYRQMPPEVRALFPQVKAIMQLLLVCPVSSSECERSFSTLRRLKTWLRNTMSQQRLNATAVCNVHSEILDEIDIHHVAKEFSTRSKIRRKIFGTF
ncbi:zinc finger MYM-type protein 1-like [Diadema setosum]|uniref:zinc finger MYM-type protein 1-like n=1 Tax=Diadema setosum TaxID=31175 RepID=UPI003B3A6C72